MIAQTPPMGWNSWDCYGASVTEEEVRANAEYMAKHLKKYGWEYVVVDIQWYEPDAVSAVYRPFVPLEMDEYSRLIPSVKRFPSARDGQGFKPLADYIHSLGLKFGIHIMRGIPRQAVHQNTPIKGTDVKAREIAHEASICLWNTDMYGVDYRKKGAQEYYNSLLEMYAQWGIDFIKVDDIAYSRLHKAYLKEEVELIRKAIDNTGREIVLSLSPGPAVLEEAEHLKKNANMWRMTDDFWDSWEQLLAEFERCDKWSIHSGEGHWPDADMLPVGHIALRAYDKGTEGRWTRFTKDEQITMMSLWCMMRSPLILGCELRSTDEWTMDLITNEEIIEITKNSFNNHQLLRDDKKVIWVADSKDGNKYVAFFNISEEKINLKVEIEKLGINRILKIRDLWKKENCPDISEQLCVEIPTHGARVFKIYS